MAPFFKKLFSFTAGAEKKLVTVRKLKKETVPSVPSLSEMETMLGCFRFVVDDATFKVSPQAKPPLRETKSPDNGDEERT